MSEKILVSHTHTQICSKGAIVPNVVGFSTPAAACSMTDYDGLCADLTRKMRIRPGYRIFRKRALVLQLYVLRFYWQEGVHFLC